MLLSVVSATVFAALAFASPIAEPFHYWRHHHPHRPHHTFSSLSNLPTATGVFPTGTGVFPTGTGLPTNGTGLNVTNSTGLFPTSVPSGTRTPCPKGPSTSLPVLAPVSSSIVFSTSSVEVSALPTSTSTPFSSPAITPTSSSISSAAPTPKTTPVRTFTPRPHPTTTSIPVPSPTTSVAPAPTPSAPGTSDGSPLSGGVSLLTTINKYRTRYNVNTLAWSAQLQANAQKTGDDDGGVNQVHELNPGSYAQVISPGATSYPASDDLQRDTPFELTFSAWLCEVSTEYVVTIFLERVM